MNRVKKGLDNQAIGLLPLLLFMFLDNYFSYSLIPQHYNLTLFISS